MRQTLRSLILAAAGALLAACTTTSSDEATIAAYCADPGRAGEAICQVHADVNRTRLDLVNTDSVAREALSRADRAQRTADQALANGGGPLECETLVLRNQQVGSCAAGWTLTGCTQTRYTYRAGGLSILREVTDAQCRFNTRVLEMQVRCCRVAGQPSSAAFAPITPPPAAPTRNPTGPTS